MKSKILAIFLAISLILAVPATALAANPDTILITMTTGEIVSVSVAPDWNPGTVAANTVYSTTDVFFTATNDGNVNEDFTIYGEDTDNGWGLSGTLTNSDTDYALGFTKTGTTWPGDYTAIPEGPGAPAALASDIAANDGTQTFGLGLETPNIIIGGVTHHANVYIGCVKHT